MLKGMRNRLRSIAMLAVAGALVVGGVAVAQDSGGSGSNSGSKADVLKGSGKPLGGPMLFGGPMKDLTYAEFHVLNRKGEAETIRTDQGEITAIGDGSITLEENDGSSVTISTDDSTAVMTPGSKPGEGSLADLEVGDEVNVSGPKGGAAEAVAEVPTKAELKKAMRGAAGGGMPAGPPMGAPGMPPGELGGSSE